MAKKSATSAAEAAGILCCYGMAEAMPLRNSEKIAGFSANCLQALYWLRYAPDAHNYSC
jgi:hypothetical protein